jgi:hypothetical protein
MLKEGFSSLLSSLMGAEAGPFEILTLHIVPRVLEIALRLAHPTAALEAKALYLLVGNVLIVQYPFRSAWAMLASRAVGKMGSLPAKSFPDVGKPA